MIIDDEILDKISRLANIKVDASEREKLKQDMSAILSWVDKLNEVDTSEIAPLIHMTTENKDLREDIDDHNLTVDEAMKNAAVKSDNYFIVPKVINRDNE